MPSANVAPAVAATTAPKKEEVVVVDYTTNPMKTALTIIEHKVRNLEKRKGKLDQYKSEQDSGKDLNSDQLSAVAKYGEVTGQLDLVRDLMKQIGQANDEARREIKKQKKVDVAEHAKQMTEKLRQLFLFQLVVKELENSDVSESNGENDDLEVLVKAVQMIKTNRYVRFSEMLNAFDPGMQESLESLAAFWSLVLEGSKKAVESEPGAQRTTYKMIRDQLMAVAKTDFLENKARREPSVEEETREDAASSDSESIPSSATNSLSQAVSEPLSMTESANQQLQQPSVPIKESQYSFLQESRIDFGSPHCDPAVVAVSSHVPPAAEGNNRNKPKEDVSIEQMTRDYEDMFKLDKLSLMEQQGRRGSLEGMPKLTIEPPMSLMHNTTWTVAETENKLTNAQENNNQEERNKSNMWSNNEFGNENEKENEANGVGNRNTNNRGGSNQRGRGRMNNRWNGSPNNGYSNSNRFGSRGGFGGGRGGFDRPPQRGNGGNSNGIHNAGGMGYYQRPGPTQHHEQFVRDIEHFLRQDVEMHRNPNPESSFGGQFGGGYGGDRKNSGGGTGGGFHRGRGRGNGFQGGNRDNRGGNSYGGPRGNRQGDRTRANGTGYADKSN